ncbi:ABC transporter [Microbacterium sp. NEAU-LLC]|uniref:ABC transporter n=1 Tax=Microbacterium helvum TaxID=2773713 RepID=A0ABR8NRP5_9MICO|nr:ABC transporter [Microbacterium helvum]MBD3943112.1 ABC transporter [Microbacterium helvum]
MSDPKSSYGEPVEEPGGVDDVVGRANEGLAEAEAAGRGVDAPAASGPDAAAGDATADAAGASDAGAGDADAVANADTSVEPDSAAGSSAEPVDASAEAPADATPAESVPSETAVGTTAAPDAAEPDPWDSAEAASLDIPAATPADTAVYASPADDAPTVVDAPVVAAPVADAPVITPSEPVVGEAAVVAAAQPIFVQAPEAPRPRGNRAAAGAIGLLAALAFAVLYLALGLGVRAIEGDVTGDNIGTSVVDALRTWSLWVPVVVFFLAFWLLGAIINRGRWGAWVIFGLLVGVAAYGGHILGALFQAPFWELTASEGSDLAESELLTPLAFGAFVIGRELTIWFGAWAAARAKRVTELNIEAQREYERTLEAGPQLVRP